MVKRFLLLASGCLALASCGTLATEGAGDENLPSSGLGPWRPLDLDEVRTAPYVTAARRVDGGAHVVALDDGTFALYRGERDGDEVSIVRETSPDGISFADAERVLAPDAAWEGGFVRDPCLVRDGAGWLLYYEAAGGIGLAEGEDGRSFARVGDGPVLALGAAWEGDRVGAPSVVRDGARWLLYYEAAGGIGLATSGDGRGWIRLRAPVLEPAPAGEWDDRVVSDPAARVHVSPTGRQSIHLFYVGVAAAPVDADPEYGVGAAAGFDGRFLSRFPENPVLERRRAPDGLGPPAEVGRVDMLVFTEENRSAFRVGGAVWPPELRLDGAEGEGDE